MLKIGPRKRRCSAEGSFQLFEEDFLLCEPRVYRTDDLLGEEAEFEQGLVMFPGPDADENSDEQGKKQKHRQRHRPRAAAPQTPWFSGDNAHERQHDEDTEGIADPP